MDLFGEAKDGCTGNMELPASYINTQLILYFCSQSSVFLVIQHTSALTIRVVGVDKDWVVVLLSALLFADSKLTLIYIFPTMSKKEGDFKLKVVEGEFRDSEIIVLLGKPGTGKTTFIRLLAGVQKPDIVEGGSLSRFHVSYQAQNMIHNRRHPLFVRDMLRDEINDSYMHPLFVSEVIEPLQIDQLMDQYLPHLSDDEFRRLLICLCLGKRADNCLIEEPCANLNPEQRNVVSRVIKRYIHLSKKTAVVVAPDFTMAEFQADKVIVFEATPSVDCVANPPSHGILSCL